MQMRLPRTPPIGDDELALLHKDAAEVRVALRALFIIVRVICLTIGVPRQRCLDACAAERIDLERLEQRLGV